MTKPTLSCLHRVHVTSTSLAAEMHHFSSVKSRSSHFKLNGDHTQLNQPRLDFLLLGVPCDRQLSVKAHRVFVHHSGIRTSFGRPPASRRQPSSGISNIGTYPPSKLSIQTRLDNGLGDTVHPLSFPPSIRPPAGCARAARVDLQFSVPFARSPF